MKKILKFFLLSLAFSTQAQNDSFVQEIDSLNKLGAQYIYVQKDSAYYYFDKAYALSKKYGSEKSTIETLFNYVSTASYHYDLAKMEVSLQELEKILGFLKNMDKPVLQENIYLLAYYRGIYEYLISRNKNAIRTFKTIVDNIKIIPDSSRTNDLKSLFSGSYSFMGKLYVEQQKYHLAKNLYNSAIRDILDNDPKNLERLYGNYNLLAEVLTKQGQYTKANDYLHRSLRYNKVAGNTNTVISSAFYLAQNHVKLQNPDSAFFYLNEAKLAFNDNPVFYSKYHSIKSEIHKNLKQYRLALDELNISKSEIEKRFDSEKSIDIAIIQNKIGVINATLNQDKKALLNYNSALEYLESEFENNIKVIEILKNKAAILNRGRIENGYLKTIKTANEASKILDILKPTFKGNDDKLTLIEDAFPLFEFGIEAAYEIYKSTNEDMYLKQAFIYSEKSKSVLLLEALLASNASQFAMVPDTLLEREQQLKSEITFFKKRLRGANEGDTRTEKQLFASQEEYRKLVDDIETNYQAYYNLKYNTKTLSLPETQRLLSENEKVISFFYGTEAIYAIGISKNSKQIERIPLTAALEDKIRDVRQMLGNPKSDITVLSQASYQLYNQLIAPFLGDTPSKLLLIPDGLLNYIPFGALNTQEEGISYLMQKYTISYANSATLYNQLLHRDTQNTNLLAFAPSFEGEVVQINPDRDKLLPLPHNKREVEQVLTSFDGKALTDAKATLQNFYQQLSDYGILHFATHANFDDTSPDFSYLAFTSEEEKENLLYVGDLYNLQINADLVTLSACETGVGELKRGEGFLSLARGFFYSGATSITSTLWKINDASTASIMDSFYKHLADGDAKDNALQKAKSEFLNRNKENGLAHPYYWSGFIVSGNTSPLISSHLWIKILLGILVLIGLFTAATLLKKRRKSF